MIWENFGVWHSYKFYWLCLSIFYWIVIEVIHHINRLVRLESFSLGRRWITGSKSYGTFFLQIEIKGLLEIICLLLDGRNIFNTCNFMVIKRRIFNGCIRRAMRNFIQNSRRILYNIPKGRKSLSFPGNFSILIKTAKIIFMKIWTWIISCLEKVSRFLLHLNLIVQICG